MSRRLFLIVMLLVAVPAGSGIAHSDSSSSAAAGVAGPSSADAGVTSASSADSELTGVTVEIAPDDESSVLSRTANVVTLFPGSWNDTNVGRFYANGTSYYVFSESDIDTGRSRVRGTVVRNTPVGPIIVASSVNTTTTRGTRVSADTLRSNPGQFHGQLVRVTLNYSQLSFTAGVDGVVTARLSLGSRSPTSAGIDPITDGLRTTNVSADTDPRALTDPPYRLNTSVSAQRLQPGLVFVSIGDRAFWTNERVTLDVVVIDEGITRAHVAARTFDAPGVEDVEAIQSGDHDGELVTVEASAAEHRLSIAETLERTFPCAPNSFTLGPVCVPAIVDTVVHTGLAFQNDSDSQAVLPYIGMSNRKQDVPSNTTSGRVRVTGRVVSANELLFDVGANRVVLASRVEYTNSDTRPVSAAVKQQRSQIGTNLRRWIESTATVSSAPEGATGSNSPGTPPANLTVVDSTTSGPGDPVGTAGESFEYSVTIRNTGESRWTGPVAASDQNGTWFVTSGPEFSLAPGESVTLSDETLVLRGGTRQLTLRATGTEQRLADAGAVYVAPTDQESTDDGFQFPGQKTPGFGLLGALIAILLGSHGYRERLVAD